MDGAQRVDGQDRTDSPNVLLHEEFGCELRRWITRCDRAHAEQMHLLVHLLDDFSPLLTTVCGKGTQASVRTAFGEQPVDNIALTMGKSRSADASVLDSFPEGKASSLLPPVSSRKGAAVTWHRPRRSSLPPNFGVRRSQTIPSCPGVCEAGLHAARSTVVGVTTAKQKFRNTLSRTGSRVSSLSFEIPSVKNDASSDEKAKENSQSRSSPEMTEINSLQFGDSSSRSGGRVIPCCAIEDAAPVTDECAAETVNGEVPRGMEVLALSRVGQFLMSPLFVVTRLLITIANCIFIGLHVDCQLIESVGHLVDDGEIKSCKSRAFIGEVACYTLFLIEILARITAERSDFLRGVRGGWNLADIVLVVASFFRFYGGVWPNLTFLRILRCVQFVALMRNTWFEELMRFVWITFCVGRTAIPTLASTLVVLAFTIFSFGVVLACFIVQSSGDSEAQNDVQHFYGSFFVMNRSLFMAVSGGDDWFNLAKPLMRLGSMASAWFMFYLAFMVFGFLNVVTALFVDQAIQQSQMNKELRVKDQINSETMFARELGEIFTACDLDRSGSLSWDEFERYLQDDRIMTYMSILDLNISEAHSLYKILDIGETGNVSIDDFVWGCLRLKGNAKSVDLCTLIYETRQTRVKFEKLLESIMTRLGYLQERICMQSTEEIRQLPELDTQSHERRHTSSFCSSDPSPTARTFFSAKNDPPGVSMVPQEITSADRPLASMAGPLILQGRRKAKQQPSFSSLPMEPPMVDVFSPVVPVIGLGAGCADGGCDSTARARRVGTQNIERDGSCDGFFQDRGRIDLVGVPELS
eukprot:TRINITY_DN20325_c0_g2_i1.p1 TRINITY_DN20325_c0_g2~~TRINITY_DN20325_c0_g2_i1.p1  ORF type:complete len:821 (-),score=108.81 TRINITY_DN20325_c0_g2_i1:39-2468(-)